MTNSSRPSRLGVLAIENDRLSSVPGIVSARKWIRGRLWQRGYYERVLRDEDHTRDVIRYILQNPVRAGLAKSPDEYPFLGGVDRAKDLNIATSWRPG